MRIDTKEKMRTREDERERDRDRDHSRRPSIRQLLVKLLNSLSVLCVSDKEYIGQEAEG